MDKPINPILGSVLMRREEIPMRDRIMDCLVSSGCEAWLSGEKLSAKFGISRAAVSKHIMTLREEGNIIESVPRRGYRLIARADPWAGTDVQEGLKTHTLGQTGWIWLKETGSTNQVAVLEAMEGAPAGLAVVARRQNRGRGSKGHSWSTLPGGLYFSVLAAPRCSGDRVADLTQLTMEACAAAARRVCGVEMECRQPNDLFIAGRKTGGVLVESMLYNGELQWAVIGMGINVNVPEDAMPEELEGIATSLYIENGKPLSMTALMKSLLEELELRLDAF